MSVPSITALFAARLALYGAALLAVIAIIRWRERARQENAR